MSSLSDDYQAEGDAIDRAYRSLQEADPKHELLAYMEMDERGSNGTILKAFWEKFQIDGDRRNIYALARYSQALAAAVQGGDWKRHVPQDGRPSQAELDGIAERAREEAHRREVMDMAIGTGNDWGFGIDEDAAAETL